MTVCADLIKLKLKIRGMKIFTEVFGIFSYSRTLRRSDVLARCRGGYDHPTHTRQ